MNRLLVLLGIAVVRPIAGAAEAVAHRACTGIVPEFVLAAVTVLRGRLRCLLLFQRQSKSVVSFARNSIDSRILAPRLLLHVVVCAVDREVAAPDARPLPAFRGSRGVILNTLDLPVSEGGAPDTEQSASGAAGGTLALRFLQLSQVRDVFGGIWITVSLLGDARRRWWCLGGMTEDCGWLVPLGRRTVLGDGVRDWRSSSSPKSLQVYGEGGRRL